MRTVTIISLALLLPVKSQPTASLCFRVCDRKAFIYLQIQRWQKPDQRAPFSFGWNSGAALAIRCNSGNPHMLEIWRLQMNSLISVSEYKKESLQFGLNASIYRRSLTGTLWSNCDRGFYLRWCMIPIIHYILNIPCNKGFSCVIKCWFQTHGGNIQRGLKMTGVCWCSKKTMGG